jgi:2-dehydropantoate 2-reductase
LGLNVACAQNGVENERVALRLFRNVYGVHVMLPASHLEPGIVQASSAPVTGLLDLGRYPNGTDETARELSAAFNASTFDSRAIADIMRWKHRKLIMNLGNAAEALVEPGPGQDQVGRRAEEEGEECLRAAGIDFASRDEDRARRGDLLRLRPVGGRGRGGGSSWQSLARGTGTIEADFLNGEIVLLGRLHGVPAPVNEALQRAAARAAAARRAPGSLSADEFL